MGEHCTEQSCKQLDYLPMKCDACSQVFCNLHLLYDDHTCSSKYKKDIQVPVCPLCSAPVPYDRGTLPDLAVSAHIDQDCKQKAKEKVYSNRCNKAKCKKKELIKIVCDACKLTFCLTHRHPNDHSCEGAAAAARQAASAAASRAAAAAASRAGQSTQSKITNFFSGPFKTGPVQPTASRSQPTAAISRPSAAGRPAAARQATAFQAGLSEDEALAAALAASMADVPGPQQQQPQGALSQEDEDRLLAQAIQESERLAGQQGQSASSNQEKSCSVS